MNGYWLLENSALTELQVAARATPSAELLAGFEARGAGVPLSVTEGVGEIAVIGILTERPSLFAMLAGGNTTYSSIREAVRQAEANLDVKEIVLLVDSPGGNVSGLFETLATVEGVRKPIRSRVGLAASAAYALAAAAGPIEAKGPASSVGSVGVVATVALEPGVVSVTSSNAPNKRPDCSTEAGRAVVREELDQIEALFIEHIARGRRVTTEKVKSSYGRGSVLLARRALESGMIDRIGGGAGGRQGGQASERGPNQRAAEELEAQLGNGTEPGANESQSAFAERLLAPVQPAPKPSGSLSQIVADIVTGKRQPYEAPEPERTTEEQRRLQSVSEIVVAALRDTQNL